jgi:hypothetical protein
MHASRTGELRFNTHQRQRLGCVARLKEVGRKKIKQRKSLWAYENNVNWFIN